MNKCSSMLKRRHYLDDRSSKYLRKAHWLMLGPQCLGAASDDLYLSERRYLGHIRFIRIVLGALPIRPRHKSIPLAPQTTDCKLVTEEESQ